MKMKSKKLSMAQKMINGKSSPKQKGKQSLNSVITKVGKHNENWVNQGKSEEVGN